MFKSGRRAHGKQFVCTYEGVWIEITEAAKKYNGDEYINKYNKSVVR